MQHRSEQLGMQRWMAKSFFKPISSGIPAFGVNLGHMQFFVRGVVIVESRLDATVEVELEQKNYHNGRKGC